MEIENKEMIELKEIKVNNDKLSESKTKDYVKKYNKTYYEKNRLKRLQDMKQKVRCEVCDCELTVGKLTLHKKSKKHQLYQKIHELGKLPEE